VLVLAVSDVVFGAVVIIVGVVGFAAGIGLALRSGRDYSQIGSVGRFGMSRGRPDSPRKPVSTQAPEDAPHD
jgi:hypothetical protein